MDFSTKVSILSDLMLWRNDLDDRLLDYFLSESNDLAVRYAVGVDLGHIHELSAEGEAMIHRAFYYLLLAFNKNVDGNYNHISEIIPSDMMEDDDEVSVDYYLNN